MPKFEFEKDGKKWEVEAPTSDAAIAAWNSTQGGGDGSSLGDFGRGVAQSLGDTALTVGGALVPGGPTVGRFLGRTLQKSDPTGASQAVSKFINEPSKSTAQTAGQITGAVAPALIPTGGAQIGLGKLLATRSALPFMHAATHAAASKLGPAAHARLHRSGLLGMAARWAAGHLGANSAFQRTMSDFGTGLERSGLGALAGAHQRTKGGADDRDEKPRGKTSSPPKQTDRPPARRPGEERARDNVPAKAERFDRRWAGDDDFRSSQSEGR